VRVVPPNAAATRRSALAVSDPGPHPPLLLAEFSPALACFLDAHAALHVWGEIRPNHSGVRL